MKLIKKLAIISIQGIGIACTIYILIGMIFDHLYEGNFVLENYTFTKQAIASIIIGIGFSAPSEIYNSEKLPFAFKFLFHMGIGCSIYLIAAYCVGWLPVSFGLINCILFALLELSVAFLIWLCFSFHYRKLAKDMNEKLHQNASDNDVSN